MEKRTRLLHGMKLLRRRRERIRRELLLTFGPPALLVVATFALAYWFVKPAPPSSLVMAIGKDEGGARWYARRYAEILARNGVTLEIRETDGSVPNLRLLADSDSGVDVAIVQSGATLSREAPDIESLGALAYVPLWVFYRGDAVLDDPVQLKGLRIAVGPAEGATRALAAQLLAVGGAEKPPTELLPFERDEAIARLKAGEIDAVFTVSPAEAPAIQRLAVEPGIRLLDLSRAVALSRRFPHLSALSVPRGVLDLAADVPQKDTAILAATSNLLVRTSLHPALAYLLMRAATEIHGGPGLLNGAGEFPSGREAGVALSEAARRYYQSGVPFLQRFLPFWAANLVDRLWVLVLPVVAVVVPFVRVIPPLYRWRVRRRIYRWYARLKELELELEGPHSGPALEEMRRRLDGIERAVNAIPTPLAYAEHLYFFREHVDLVRRRIADRLGEDAAAPSPVSESASEASNVA